MPIVGRGLSYPPGTQAPPTPATPSRRGVRTPTFDEIVEGDIDVFLEDAGVVVAYTSVSGVVLPDLVGIFTDGFVEVVTASSEDVSSQELVLDVSLADFVSPAGSVFSPQAGDWFTLNDRTFEVVDVQRDGFGMAKLVLFRNDGRSQI